MTEEEREAIKHLNNYIYDNEVKKSIEIVLNLVQKLQKDIEDNEDKFSELEQEICCTCGTEDCPEDCKICLKGHREAIQEDLKKKDKIIDEVIKELWNEHYLFYMNVRNIKNEKELKRYFERKI